MSSFFRTFCLSSLMVLNSVSYSQVPNGSFENWEEEFPEHWRSGKFDTLKIVERSTDAKTGNYAAVITAHNVNGSLAIGALVSADDEAGFPVNSRYKTFTFYYKFKPVLSTGFLSASVDFGKDNVTVGSAFVLLREEANEYVKVTIPINYVSEEVPDKAVIAFMVSDDTWSPEAGGTYAVVDDITFDLVTGVDDEILSVSSYKLEQNFPNPFNPITRINYTIPQTASGEKVTLKVYDVIGDEVAALVNDFKPAGEYTAEFDGKGLPSGIYIYRLQAGSFVVSRKMTLLK